MDAHLAALLSPHWLTPLKDFIHDKWRWEADRDADGEGVLMARNVRKKNGWGWEG